MDDSSYVFQGMVLQSFLKQRETDIKPVSLIEQENSVEADLSLAKLHVCIALFCLDQHYKIIKNSCNE